MTRNMYLPGSFIEDMFRLRVPSSARLFRQDITPRCMTAADEHPTHQIQQMEIRFLESKQVVALRVADWVIPFNANA